MDFLLKLLTKNEILEIIIIYPFDVIVKSFNTLIENNVDQDELIQIMDTAILIKLNNKEEIPIDVLQIMDIEQLYFTTDYQKVPDELFCNYIETNLQYLIENRLKIPIVIFLYIDDNQLITFIKKEYYINKSTENKKNIIWCLLRNRSITKIDTKWLMKSILNRELIVNYFKDQIMLVDQKSWITEILKKIDLLINK